MARNKQIDVDGDESGSSSHGRDSKKMKSKGPRTNPRDANSHTKGNQKNLNSERSLDLGVYTNTANTAIRNMMATQDAMNNLAQQYRQHVTRIEQIDEIQAENDRLKQQCKTKDEKINNQKTTIDTLCEKTRDEEQRQKKEKIRLEKEKTTLEEDKKKLDKDKTTAAKRLKAQGAEQETKMQKILEERLAELEKRFNARGKELECGIKKREEDNTRRLTNLEAKNTTLREAIAQLEKEREEHRITLTKAKDDFDNMTRLRDSHKTDAQKLETRLKAMENEFVTNHLAPDFYIEEFARISRTIQEISEKYFQDLKNEDINNIHQQLIRADIAFATIPISQSQESRMLRIARAQVIISSSLCDIIWQPFSSEKTAQDPNFALVLCDVSAELAKTTHGKMSAPRVAGIWRALTMRALQSLPALPSTESNARHLSRAESVVERVISTLSPLLSSSQEPQFREELHALAESAISVWSSAQTGELQLTVSSCLESAQRDEWRSLAFDPPSTNEVATSTYPRVFTLFPRVTALKVPVIAETLVSLPGSWPEHNEDVHMVETCVHPGIGLPEWSALVLKGEEEEDWRKECIKKELIQDQLAALQKELKASGERRNVHSYSRTDSAVGQIIRSNESDSAMGEEPSSS